mmetsp:Transcript_24105/g.33683  ORF Transcript_24105/g.33683 Transcript_24105/m.33683 type:complete len:123 (-) Transcript_24105:240-608(-)
MKYCMKARRCSRMMPEILLCRHEPYGKKLAVPDVPYRHVFRVSSNSNWGLTDDRSTELAANIPDPATAGTPIPGKQLSPQSSKPLMGVPGKGNGASVPATMAGPYEPRCRRRKRWCVSGVPT